MQAEVIGADIDVMPDVPRTVSRQLSRDNVEHASPEEYYRRSIVLPLLDHSIQQMKERFRCFSPSLNSLNSVVKMHPSPSVV